MKKALFLTAVLALMLQVSSFAQSIKLNNQADPGSAILEVNSASKGILIPNVALTGTADATTIALPAVSLLVYNTTTVGNIIPGYYYNSGTSGSPIWTRLSTGTLGDGSETKVEAGTNVTVTGSGTSASPYIINALTPSPTTYTIGLSAEQGGYIFWVSADGKHGLVAETVDQSSFPNLSNWYNAQNIILDPSNHSTAGAKFRDWRMPTKYELNEMYLQQAAIGGSFSGYYWSSSEIDNNLAWLQSFFDGIWYSSDKYGVYNRVRAVRSF